MMRALVDAARGGLLVKEKAVIDVITPATQLRLGQLAQHIERQWRDFRGSTDGSDLLEESSATTKVIGIALSPFMMESPGLKLS